LRDSSHRHLLLALLLQWAHAVAVWTGGHVPLKRI
jgi:hypothetical protein